MSVTDDDTIEQPTHTHLRHAEEIVPTLVQEFGIEIAALTHRGRVRVNNEDQYSVIRRTRSGTLLASSLDDAAGLVGEEQHAWLLAVADGLGGHASGEVASATAIRTILRLANGLSSWIMRPVDGKPREDIAERVELYAQAIQQEMVAQAADNPGLDGMATTVTAAYIFASSVMVVNVGDSRSYLLHDGGIQQITRDHTVAQYMRDEGLNPHAAHRYSNLLTRTFSTEHKHVDFDLFHLAVEPGDRILLCSDGLTDMLSNDEILEIANLTSSTRDACELLVKAALEKGGRDNVTVVLARV